MADETDNIEPVDAGVEAPAPEPAKKPVASAPDVKLNGLQKAAVLMVTIGPERAAQIMRHLDPDETDPLVVEVAHMQNLPPEYVNVVMNDAGHFIEVQGTAEGHAFRREELNALLDLASSGIRELMELQRKALTA